MSGDPKPKEQGPEEEGAPEAQPGQPPEAQPEQPEQSEAERQKEVLSEARERHNRLSKSKEAAVKSLLGPDAFKKLEVGWQKNVEISLSDSGCSVDLVVSNNRDLFEVLAFARRKKKDFDSPEAYLDDRVVSRAIGLKNPQTNERYNFCVYDRSHAAVEAAEGGNERYKELKVDELKKHEDLHSQWNLLFEEKAKELKEASDEGDPKAELEYALFRAQNEILGSVMNRTDPKTFAFKFNNKHKSFGHYNYQKDLGSRTKAEYQETVYKAIDSLEDLMVAVKGDAKKAKDLIIADGYVSLKDWPGRIDDIISNLDDSDEAGRRIFEKNDQKGELSEEFEPAIDLATETVRFLKKYPVKGNEAQIEAYEKYLVTFEHEKRFPTKKKDWIRKQVATLRENFKIFREKATKDVDAQIKKQKAAVEVLKQQRKKEKGKWLPWRKDPKKIEELDESITEKEEELEVLGKKRERIAA
jgi:hypothetical protein